MQGRWIVVDEPSSELLIDGGEVTCFGARIRYDWKDIGERHGALSVGFGIDDASLEDTFRRANITDLVITPEGEFLGYNVKFSCAFVRP
jgi:hypothetical protein